MLLVALLLIKLVYIAVFFTMVFGSLLTTSGYFSLADGNIVTWIALNKCGDAFNFVSGLIDW